MQDYETVMGLEIHAELSTASKIFCDCENAFGGAPNSRICPICTGQPGVLPRLNRQAVALAVQAGLALDGEIAEESAFDRKNYIYPDLPKAYQITQLRQPIVKGGFIEKNGKSFRIHHIHLEEDAGKLVHTPDFTGIDYNRCGVPLVEIVTEPDFRSAQEIKDFVEEVILRLQYAGICDGRMEQGSLRVDVNLSVRPAGAEQLGERTEMKNLNSFRFIKRAVEYESRRQIELLENGGQVFRETLRFLPETGETTVMRSKEEVADYRYFPEPDLPVIHISEQEIEMLRTAMPQMPHIRRNRYQREYGLSEEAAVQLTAKRETADFFERVCNLGASPRETAKLILTTLIRLFRDNQEIPGSGGISAEQLAGAVRLLEEGRISKTAAKELVAVLFYEDCQAQEAAEAHGWILEDHDEQIKAYIDRIILENPKCAEDFRNGNQKSGGYLMGLLMRSGISGIHPGRAREYLEQRLKSHK